MPREHGGDSTPVVDPSRTGYLTAVRLLSNRAGSAAARLNQSDIVFIFSIRLEPTKTLQGSG